MESIHPQPQQDTEPGRAASGIPPIDGPTWVYSAFCEHGGLLYVGVARDVARRVRQHRKKTVWWKREVDAVLAYQYATRREALDCERHYITIGRPVHNVAGAPGCTAQPHEVAPHPVTGFEILNSQGNRT